MKEEREERCSLHVNREAREGKSRITTIKHEENEEITHFTERPLASCGRYDLSHSSWSFPSLLIDTAALRVTMRESSLKVVQGDFVVLPCSFFTSSPLSRLNVIWTLAPFSSPETPIQV